MGFSPKQEQKLKFYLLCALAPIGLMYYFYNGGSVLNAAILFLAFGVVEKIANLGYHRWLAHNMFEVGWIGSTILLWCMVASGLARPASYVGAHRMHHKHSDTEKDPHNTKLGFWNSLVGNFNTKTFEVSNRDIFKKKHIIFVQKNYFLLMILNLIFFWFINKNIVYLSFSLLNLRFLLSVTAFNYFAHGGIALQKPVNLSLWKAILIGSYLGEHLHKNHHDNPNSFNYGCDKDRSFDPTYQILKRIVTCRST